MAERPIALPPEVRGAIPHATATTTAAILIAAAAILTTTAPVRSMRQDDCHTSANQEGPTSFRGSMPSVQACRHIFA